MLKWIVINHNGKELKTLMLSRYENRLMMLDAYVEMLDNPKTINKEGYRKLAVQYLIEMSKDL